MAYANSFKSHKGLHVKIEYVEPRKIIIIDEAHGGEIQVLDKTQAEALAKHILDASRVI